MRAGTYSSPSPGAPPLEERCYLSLLFVKQVTQRAPFLSAVRMTTLRSHSRSLRQSRPGEGQGAGLPGLGGPGGCCRAPGDSRPPPGTPASALWSLHLLPAGRGSPRAAVPLRWEGLLDRAAARLPDMASMSRVLLCCGGPLLSPPGHTAQASPHTGAFLGRGHVWGPLQESCLSGSAAFLPRPGPGL